MKSAVYLDYNATAPLRPEAREAILAALKTPLNASSIHSFGRAGRKTLEEARAKVAALVGAAPSQVIFNSGATEGNNTVLKYFSNERILVSAIEHPSVLESAPRAEKIPVTEDGIIDLDALEKILTSPPTLPSPQGGEGYGGLTSVSETSRSWVGGKPQTLLSVMLANNETGAIQPIEKISEIAKRHGIFFHCDAAQAASKIAIDMTGIDFLTLSAHKIGGPQGAGALVMGLCGITPTLIDGGGQEKKARAGTENVAAIAGFGAAAEAARRDLAQEAKRQEGLRSLLESELCKLNNSIIVHSKAAPRLPNTSMFSIPGAKAETLLMAFDLEGIALSNGSACSSGTVRASHVLKAMGCNDDLASSALRVSMGWDTTEGDIEKFLETFKKINARLNK